MWSSVKLHLRNDVTTWRLICLCLKKLVEKLSSNRFFTFLKIGHGFWLFSTIAISVGKKSLFSKQILLFSIIFSVRIKYDFFFFSFSYLLLSFQEYWFKLQLSFLSIYSLNIAAPILGIVNLHYWRKSSERSRNSEQLQQARDWYVFGIYSWWQVAWISIRDFWPLTTCY